MNENKPWREFGYSDEYPCYNCKKMTSTRDLVWVRIRLIIPPYGTSVKYCKVCSNS